TVELAPCRALRRAVAHAVNLARVGQGERIDDAMALGREQAFEFRHEGAARLGKPQRPRQIDAHHSLPVGDAMLAPRSAACHIAPANKGGEGWRNPYRRAHCCRWRRRPRRMPTRLIRASASAPPCRASAESIPAPMSKMPAT